MNTMLLGIRTLIFALSVFGYLTFLHKRTNLPTEFLPAITFAGEICILYLAGILNLLPLTVWGLLLLGLLLAFLSLKDWKIYRDFFCPGYIFFVLACAYFMFLLKGQLFDSYDNFSHWALVVKQMLITDRFPTWQDDLILFQSYPLGSSVFVYFVSKIISHSEGCQMFAQTMLTLSMMLPLFSCVRKHKVSGLILTLGTVLFLLSYLIQPISLYVDTLLPLTGAAGLVLLEEEFKQERKTTWAATALAVAVMLIKNSGIFFWALMALAVLDFGIRHFREVSRQEKLSWGGLLLIPPFYLLLWQKHVKYVFYSGMTAIHSMSLSAYLENFRAKASTSIPVILDAFQDKVRSGRGLLFLLLFILICVLFAHIQHLSGKGLIRLAIYLIAVYAVYQAGNLCMYLFSMPEGEALVMAGYTRYYGAIIIFCYSYAIYHILKWADSISISYHWILCVLSLLLFWKMGANIQPLQRHQIAAARIQLDNLVTEYSIEPSRNYLVFIPENDAYYTYHLFKYVLYTPIVDLHFSADGENFEEVLNTAIDLGYDYFVNLDPDNAQIAEYCLEHYGADAGPVIRLQ